MRTEPGAASVRVELSRGVVTVYHGDTGDILAQGKCPLGGWNDIWCAIWRNTLTDAEVNTNSHASTREVKNNAR